MRTDPQPQATCTKTGKVWSCGFWHYVLGINWPTAVASTVPHTNQLHITQCRQITTPAPQHSIVAGILGQTFSVPTVCQRVQYITPSITLQTLTIFAHLAKNFYHQFFKGWVLFLPPNYQHQSSEGNRSRHTCVTVKWKLKYLPSELDDFFLSPTSPGPSADSPPPG